MSDASDLAAARQRIQAAYEPELLRAAGHRLAELLADHLATFERSEGLVLPWCTPPDNVRQATAIAAAAEQHPPADRAEWLRRFGELVQTMLRRGLNLHHPRYIGNQVPAPLPLAGLFDAV